MSITLCVYTCVYLLFCSECAKARGDDCSAVCECPFYFKIGPAHKSLNACPCILPPPPPPLWSTGSNTLSQCALSNLVSLLAFLIWYSGDGW